MLLGVSQLVVVCRFSADSTTESNRKCGNFIESAALAEPHPLYSIALKFNRVISHREECKLVYETVLDRFETNFTSTGILDLIIVELFVVNWHIDMFCS